MGEYDGGQADGRQAHQPAIGERLLHVGDQIADHRGEDEGLRLLHLLAVNPATIHHVSAQLCARFVADVPPDGCIDDAVRAWKKSDGDIRTVVRAVNDLLEKAVELRASDIHIEPFSTGLVVRMRIDGLLRPVAAPAGVLCSASSACALLPAVKTNCARRCGNS